MEMLKIEEQTCQINTFQIRRLNMERNVINYFPKTNHLQLFDKSHKTLLDHNYGITRHFTV